mmetsp:Transcript_16007/g.34672  ORF Transcript_16007/g.34672 Transcript_16007/m.34672 type:complete len:479 (-) Transcript_16007:3097-4533(-)
MLIGRNLASFTATILAWTIIPLIIGRCIIYAFISPSTSSPSSTSLWLGGSVVGVGESSSKETAATPTLLAYYWSSEVWLAEGIFGGHLVQLLSDYSSWNTLIIGDTKNKTESLNVSSEQQQLCLAVNPLYHIQGGESVIHEDSTTTSAKEASVTASSAEQQQPHSVGHSTRHPPHIAEVEMQNGRTSPVSPTYTIPSYFSLDMSTEENYGEENMDFFGPFEGIRSNLDYSYHENYTKNRQQFQDKIVEQLLDGTVILDEKNGRVCKTPTEPWIVFTAGVMGAGKSHTIRGLAAKGVFPLQSYVAVDPDEIRQQFPEFHLYASLSPEKAGELTHKEAGYVTEIVTAAALQRGHNVLVDGSLRDADWYLGYFERLRRKYTNLKIAILHVTAPREAVFERARNRAKVTGRVVPRETLEQSILQVPVSIKKLAPLADFFCELDNAPGSGEITIKTEGVTWDSFRDVWSQTCPWPPPKPRGKM